MRSIKSFVPRVGFRVDENLAGSIEGSLSSGNRNWCSLMRTSGWWLLCLAVCCSAVGCQPRERLVSVSGKVLVDGQPLDSGTVSFVPESGRPVTSAILPDGSFQLASSSVGQVRSIDGIPPGKYQVAVSSSKIISEEEELVEWGAPKRYADFRTSGLEANIQESTNDLVLELNWTDADREEVKPPAAEPGAGGVRKGSREIFARGEVACSPQVIVR